jgi:hypothetical protein
MYGLHAVVEYLTEFVEDNGSHGKPALRKNDCRRNELDANAIADPPVCQVNRYSPFGGGGAPTKPGGEARTFAFIIHLGCTGRRADQKALSSQPACALTHLSL